MCQSFHSNTEEQQHQHENLSVPPPLESQRRSRPAMWTHTHTAPADSTIRGFKREQRMSNEAPDNKQDCSCHGKCVQKPCWCPGAGGDIPSRNLPLFPTYPSVLETWRGGGPAIVWGHITPWGGHWGCISADPPPQHHWHKVPFPPK